jgi:hypothetical protein
MRLGRNLLPLSLISATVLFLPACSVLEDWGVIAPSTSSSEIIDEEITAVEVPEGVAPVPSEEGFSLPGCDNLYSTSLNTVLLDEVRVNLGDTSEGDYGYGTTQGDLVKILQNVRSDLKLSCTWNLQASGESASVTSAAVITSEVERDVRRFLTSSGGTGEDIGGGYVWTVESPLSQISPDVEVTEVHYLAAITCPALVSDQECVLWVSTNYSFGEARELTLDAAENLGAFSN